MTTISLQVDFVTSETLIYYQVKLETVKEAEWSTKQQSYSHYLKFKTRFFSFTTLIYKWDKCVLFLKLLGKHWPCNNNCIVTNHGFESTNDDGENWCESLVSHRQCNSCSLSQQVVNHIIGYNTLIKRHSIGGKTTSWDPKNAEKMGSKFDTMYIV